MGRLKKTLPYLFAAAVFAACVLMLFLPPPRTLARGAKRYVCTWEDGTETALSEAEAFDLLEGADGGGIVLFDGEKHGRIASDAQMRAAYEILARGSLLSLLALDVSQLPGLERTALFCEYGETLWYAGGAFGFDGTSVSPKEAEYARRVVLLSGQLPADFLKETGARELGLAYDAELEASALIGSEVEAVTAEPPYAFEDGAIYLDTPGGRRFVAALPALTELTVRGCAFADRGALLPCKALQKLTLPFVGSSLSGMESGFSGELLWLFQTADGYTMSETLTSVTVTGGTLGAYAFYGCYALEEIDACGVSPEKISPQAFLGANGLTRLHTPRSDVLLEGEFSSHTAPCGCTVYERARHEDTNEEVIR